MLAKDRIILALDVDTAEEALQLVGKLSAHVGVFKIGMQLYDGIGPDIIKRVHDLGGRVFLDLKLHDIPNTVAAASRLITRFNTFMFNVHAAGGREMMSQAAQAAREQADRQSTAPPLLLAVTVLTSISQQELAEDMLVTSLSVEELVVKWALMAQQSGIGGVVCSPQEIIPIRKACGPDFKIVTPGIRPLWSAANDQKRITTPRQALDQGADFMVIGRPIVQADDPVAAARRIIDELEA